MVPLYRVNFNHSHLFLIYKSSNSVLEIRNNTIKKNETWDPGNLVMDHGFWIGMDSKTWN